MTDKVKKNPALWYVQVQSGLPIWKVVFKVKDSGISDISQYKEQPAHQVDTFFFHSQYSLKTEMKSKQTFR